MLASMLSSMVFPKSQIKMWQESHHSSHHRSVLLSWLCAFNNTVAPWLQFASFAWEHVLLVCHQHLCLFSSILYLQKGQNRVNMCFGSIVANFNKSFLCESILVLKLSLLDFLAQAQRKSYNGWYRYAASKGLPKMDLNSATISAHFNPLTAIVMNNKTASLHRIIACQRPSYYFLKNFHVFRLDVSPAFSSSDRPVFHFEFSQSKLWENTTLSLKFYKQAIGW